MSYMWRASIPLDHNSNISIIRKGRNSWTTSHRSSNSCMVVRNCFRNLEITEWWTPKKRATFVIDCLASMLATVRQRSEFSICFLEAIEIRLSWNKSYEYSKQFLSALTYNSCNSSQCWLVMWLPFFAYFLIRNRDWLFLQFRLISANKHFFLRA